jgi:hypothetical protein
MAAIAASVAAPDTERERAEPTPVVALPAPTINKFTRLINAALDQPEVPIVSWHIIDASVAQRTTADACDYPSHAGDMRAAVQMLCIELNRVRGHLAMPQRGCQFLRVSLGNGEAVIEYEYSPGKPGRISGPPEDCYEDEPEELAVIQVLVNGAWVDADLFAPAVIEQWEQAIRDDVQLQREADEEAGAVRRYEAAMGL